jgi:hypothetical protein
MRMHTRVVHDCGCVRASATNTFAKFESQAKRVLIFCEFLISGAVLQVLADSTYTNKIRVQKAICTNSLQVLRKHTHVQRSIVLTGQQQEHLVRAMLIRHQQLITNLQESRQNMILVCLHWL